MVCVRVADSGHSFGPCLWLGTQPLVYRVLFWWRVSVQFEKIGTARWGLPVLNLFTSYLGLYGAILSLASRSIGVLSIMHTSVRLVSPPDPGFQAGKLGFIRESLAI